MRSRQVTLIALVSTTVALITIWIYRTSEPVVRGKPITHWLDASWTPSPEEAESHESLAAAFADMDERCVRWLIRELEWRPSRLKRWINHAAGHFTDSKLFPERPDRRAPAAYVLAQLGTRARPAIPALERLVRDGCGPGSRITRGTIVAALIKLREDTLTNYFGILRDPENSDWELYVSAIELLGTNGAAAAPALIEAIGRSNRESVQRLAAETLAGMQGRPELTVPALTKILTHTNSAVRYAAVGGLRLLGTSARPAWQELLNRLNDSDPAVRRNATNALLRINPAAARQRGIN